MGQRQPTENSSPVSQLAGQKVLGRHRQEADKAGGLSGGKGFYIKFQSLRRRKPKTGVRDGKRE